ncbi:MAG TPA: 2-C-methyl-D-erythritol 4-phosphate cytidylyltransferase [Candidatus Limnocylindrales bacterium]|nr:2-C-methyl-D-erythritol 4-phosphate cytidylyltransferase [Candidatus Limnocylindrales bacterium]
MAGDPVVAVLLAAGGGSRMAAGRNKVFLDVGRQPMLAWSLDLFDRVQEVDAVILVGARAELSSADRLLKDLGLGQKVKQIVAGGASRQESEWNGLRAAAAVTGGQGVVLIQDAARPFTPGDLIPRLIAEARGAGGAILAIPAAPTVVVVDNGMVTGFPSGLWAAQTPQAFRLAEILAAHEQARQDGFQATDTAAIYERAGGTVRVVEGSPDNIKITTPEDLERAEAIARRRSA